jgi:hypothetical protein
MLSSYPLDSNTSPDSETSAGVGRYGFGSRDDPVEAVMASAEPKPDFAWEWAVLGLKLPANRDLSAAQGGNGWGNDPLSPVHV